MVYRELYAPIEPHANGHLAVGDGHEVYWEVSGNANGVPVIFLHGGPGAGARIADRQYFDPAYYRIVILDQRGSGRSKPLGEIKANSTPHLISDIEAVRSMLGIKKWVVFGGSWGSTLSLAYAQRHPERVMGMILRGIFLAQSHEIHWYLVGMRAFAPEAWERFAQPVGETEPEAILRKYHEQITDTDPGVHMPAARRWGAYEGACATLLPMRDVLDEFAKDDVCLGLARMNVHYFMHDMFLAPGSLLENVDRIRNIPAVIVHGRYDLICPIVNADRLARAWPEATYTIVPDAGHSAMEPGIRSALIGATDGFRAIQILDTRQ